MDHRSMAAATMSMCCRNKQKKDGERSSSGGGGSKQAGMRKGPWTEEEDAQLVWFVRLFGERRSEAHRQELPSPVGQLPPPGPPPRPHHRRRGAPHPRAPRAVRQQVVAHRQEPPRPHRQRDQELLEDAHQEAEGSEDGGVGVLVVDRDHHHRVLLRLSEQRLRHGRVVVGGHRFSAARERRRRRRRGRRRARRGVHHRGKPASPPPPAAAAGSVVLHHGPVLERDRGSRGGGELHGRRLGRSVSPRRRRAAGDAVVAGVGILLGLLALEDRRRRVLQEDARRLLMSHQPCLYIRSSTMHLLLPYINQSVSFIFLSTSYDFKRLGSFFVASVSYVLCILQYIYICICVYCNYTCNTLLDACMLCTSSSGQDM
uniref:Myb-like domain-containing protein n=1 Tax=Setaria viridis TaxID=4556 RepID=A0A4U6V612_SETVI|nr:hypothetical protein SEVIR_3G063100v2 [Setaria viridis]